MPYIFHTQRGFTLIDSTPKNGLFCQSFPPSYPNKPMPIFSQHTTEYCACMDSTNKFYIAVLPDGYHLSCYTSEGNHFIKHPLTANQNASYKLSSPIIFTLQDQAYIIYLSHSLSSDTYSFVLQNLKDSNLTVLLNLEATPELIKSYSVKDQLWIFFILKDTYYHLQALHITPASTTLNTFLNVADPIVDYSVCIEEELLHVTYVSELHGKYQLTYFNSQTQTLTRILTTQSPCHPVIFSYYNMIWINILLNHKIQMILSIDNGQNFSIPTPCSLQNNLYRCYFFTQKRSPFIGQELYASLGSNLRLCTLGTIDFPKFHHDSHIAPELELLIEGLVLSLDELTTSTQVPSSPASDNTFSPTNHSSRSINTSNIDQAKSDFMRNLEGWELPPKI